RSEGRDRILLAPLPDFFLGAVLLEKVGRPVRDQPVGVRLDAIRLARLADTLRGSLGNLEDRFEIHAVDALPFDAVGLVLLAEVRHRRRALDAGAHAVLVVFEDEEAGAHLALAPEASKVRCLVEGAVVHRAVAVIELDDAVLAAIALGVGHADAKRNVPADDAVAAHHAAFRVEEVHGAALALHDAGALAIELRHHGLRIRTLQDGVRVVTVGRDRQVALLQVIDEAHRDGFLAAVHVEITADLALTE